MSSKTRQIDILCEFSKSKFELIENLLHTIENWNNVASCELTHRQSYLENKHDVNEYDWDILADERYILDKTNRVMYATIAVALFAVFEDFLFSLCVCAELLKVDIEKTKDGKEKRTIKDYNDKEINKPNWGQYRDLIKNNMNIQFDDISCHYSIQKVRLLNNCFKHSDGNIDDNFSKSYGGSIGDDIPYESENWQELIENCKTFMLKLTDKVRNHICQSIMMDS
jgi:hypothetical protein